MQKKIVFGWEIVICTFVAAVLFYYKLDNAENVARQEGKSDASLQQIKSSGVNGFVSRQDRESALANEYTELGTAKQQDTNRYDESDVDLLKAMSTKLNSKPLKDPDAFLERLNEVKTTNIKEEEQEQAAAVHFSTIHPGIQVAYDEYKSTLPPESIRVYAIFEFHHPPEKGKDSVLVKWHNSNKDILMFEYVRIDPNSKVNYIWKELPYWSPGNYNVDIFEENEEISLLATGSYQVSELSEYYSYLALYAGVDYGFSMHNFNDTQQIMLKLNYSSLADRYIRFKIIEVASNTLIYEQEELFPAAYKWQKKIYLNDYVSEIPPGTYQVNAFDQNSNTIARTIFYMVNN